MSCKNLASLAIVGLSEFQQEIIRVDFNKGSLVAANCNVCKNLQNS